MMSDDDNEEYLLQLRSIFDSCDTSASGTLNKTELTWLCEKLDFACHTQILIDILLGDDPEARVDFDSFRDAFIAVLSKTTEGSEDKDSEGDLSDLDYSDNSLSPHHTPRTRQELLLRISSLEEVDEDYMSSPTSSQKGKAFKSSAATSPSRSAKGSDKESSRESLYMSPRGAASKPPRESPRISPTGPRRISPTGSPEISPTGSPTGSPKISPTGISPKVTVTGTSPDQRSPTADSPETFESEGQMEKLSTDTELEKHKHHLHLVWQELGVGRKGFLTMEELASVCRKIGMEEMNDEELQHLFDKLDVDGDGRVSFDEFLRGLFQYGGTSAAHSPSRQLSATPRQKLRKALSNHMEEQRETPSLMASESGLFSALDVHNTGFAKPEEIIALWESFGIRQGAEILEYLQFSLTGKINLAELSYALEQEVHSVEEDNATYQAAISSYEHELRYLKHLNEHLTAERDKLKSDLSELKNRVEILVKEGDERYSLLEKSKEKEKNELEKKYKEQIRALQTLLEEERQTFYSQSSSDAQKLEEALSQLKEEESKLRDRVVSVQKDYDRLERENRDMAEKYAELEAKKECLQRDLEATAELQQKLEEMESTRDGFYDEHQMFSEHKLYQLQSENQELKDKADEMTAEIEQLRQQVLAYKRHLGATSDHRQLGSDMLAYDQLLRAESSSPQDTGDEASEDDANPVKVRRRLPRRPGDLKSGQGKDTGIVSVSAEKLQVEVNQLKAEKESLVNQHKEQIKILEKQHEEQINLLITNNREQLKAQEQELDQKLQALQEEHDRIVQSIRKDHQEIIKSLESHYQEKLDKQEETCKKKLEQLQLDYEEKLKDLQKEHDVELSLLQSKHEDQIQELHEMYEKRICELESKKHEGQTEMKEYEERIRRNEEKHAEVLRAVEEQYEQKIREIEDKHEKDLERMQEEYETKIEQMATKHAEEVEEVQEEYEEKIKEMESKHEEILDSLQSEHDEEVKGLQQKLDGLSSETNIKTEEVFALQRGFSLERKDIEDAYKMEIAEMEDRHMREMNEMMKKLKAEKENLQMEFDEKLKEKLAEQEEKLRGQFEQEKQDLLIKVESEKNLLRVEFEKNKERISAEYQHELAKKEVEIEKLSEKVKTLSEELEKQKVAFELQLKLQKEELELEFRKEKINMLEKFNEEKAKLLEKHRNDIYDYENIYMKGTDALRGQLRTDFFKLLEETKQEEERKLEAKFQEEFQKKEQALAKELKREYAKQILQLEQEKEAIKQEKEELLQNLNAESKNERDEVEEEQKRIIEELTKEKERLEKEWKTEKERLNEDHERELLSRQEVIDDLQRKVAALEQEKDEVLNEKKAMEMEYRSRDQEQEALWKKTQADKEKEIQQKLENDFLQQIDKLKRAFLEEREQLEKEVKDLRQELERHSKVSSEAEQKRREAENVVHLLEEKQSWYESQIQDLSRAIGELKDEKHTVNEENQALRKKLDKTIDELMTAKKLNPEMDAILQEIRHLAQKTDEIERSRENSIPLKVENERLKEETKQLLRALEEKSKTLDDALEQSLSAEDYKARVSNLETERDALRQQLQMTTERLNNASTSLALAKSEHQRELAALRAKMANMMEMDKHKQLKKELADAQNKIGQLEAALEKRAAETTRMIMGTQADHKRRTERLEQEKEEAERKAELLQKLLDEQVAKLNDQYQESDKANLLVKDLYVENSQLMKALYEAEKRGKDAEKKASNLETKCKEYIHLIRDLVPIAMK